MRTKHVTRRDLALAVAALSLASGAALLIAPRPVGALYGLPRRRRLLRWLGLRDMAIGALGLAGNLRISSWARAAADLYDAVLIGGAGAGTDRRGSATKLRVAIAIHSSLFAAHLGGAAR